jgi:WD40 repeat protein
MGDSADDTEDVKPPPKTAHASSMRRSQSAPYTALGFSSANSIHIPRPPQINSTRSSSSSTAPYYNSFVGSSAYAKVPRSSIRALNNSTISFLPSVEAPKPDYKLLHQTHIKLRNRILTSSYRLSTLQTRGRPSNAHSNTIYCLQLYTYPDSGNQVLFTGSRDKTIREWNLSTGNVERVIENVHSSSILTVCVHDGYLASAGSDRRVALWHLGDNRLEKVVCDHDDSVLCVRFNDTKLVSCSKGQLLFVRVGRF